MLKAPPNHTEDKEIAATRDRNPASEGERKAASAPPEKRSIGEKVGSQLTYTGIGYFANLIVSIAIWDFFISGKGKPVYKGIARGSKKALSAGGMPEKAAENLGNSVAKYIFAPLGGHLTMIPTKMAEDHARYLAHKANIICDKDYEHKDIKATLKTPEEDLPALVKEPTEQTWTQAALRRGMAWGSVIGAGTLADKAGLSAPLENGTVRAFNRGVEMTGSKTLKTLANKPAAQRWTKLTALDMYFTVITSGVVYLTNNMFGEKRNAEEKPAGAPVAAGNAPVADAAPNEAPPGFSGKLRMDGPASPLRAATAHASHAERLAAAELNPTGPGLPA